MDESDSGPVTRNEYDPSAGGRWLNPGLLLVLVAVPVVGTLDHYVPTVHRILARHEEIRLLLEGGALAFSVGSRAIKRRFSRRPIEQMPDWL